MPLLTIVVVLSRHSRKYDMPLLKKLALENIRDGLGRCDIVEEVFSELSSMSVIDRCSLLGRVLTKSTQ